MSRRLGSVIVNHPRRMVAGVAAIVAGMLLAGVLLASVSLGARPTGAPRFSEAPRNEEVFSTRALIALELYPEGLATKWTAQYSSAGPNGPWTEVNGGEIPGLAYEGENTTVQIGLQDHARSGSTEEPVLLRGLKPETSYYARFTAENADDKGEPVEKVIPFKTLPVEKPAVDRGYLSGRTPESTSFEESSFPTDTTAGFGAKIDANGAETKYTFEYAPAEAGGGRPGEGSAAWKAFTSGASGTVGAVEGYAWVEADLAGLTPETTYYVRVKMRNSAGETVQAVHKGDPEFGFFTTGTARPAVEFGGVNEANAVRNVTTDSAYLSISAINPRGSETDWGLEYTTEPGNAGSWSAVPGGSGTISQALAEATSYLDPTPGTYGVRLTGLSASRTYYVRAFVSNTCVGCEHIDSGVVSFTTAGPPTASVDTVHALHGESLRLLGSVDPNSAPTSAEQVISLEGAPTGGSFTLTFDGHTTSEIPYDAEAETVRKALEGIPGGGPQVGVEGGDGGPYTVFFYSSPGVSEPLIEGSGLGLTPLGGSVKVVTTLAGGAGYATNYHFEYVSQSSFSEHGWADAASGPELDAGSGRGAEAVGDDLPSLSAGAAYRYRLVAQSEAPGTGPVYSTEEGTLTAPAPASAVSSEACPNEAFRTGDSAHLPDCRAYEQLTPVDKNGAQEPFHYAASLDDAVLVGEDGDNVVLEAEGTDYREGPDAGQSPYLFSREVSGWGMIAGLAQPQAGVRRYAPQVYSSDLTQVASSSEYKTSTESESADVEYDLGPVGGPYRTVASVPRQDVEGENGSTEQFAGWVGGDPSLSKLVLETQDHTLISEEETGTQSGWSDLYEYTARNGLAQLNVSSEGTTIGSCGAHLVDGYEDAKSERIGDGDGSPHNVSADGSLVFFEAVPGKKCGVDEEAPDLYMRVNGSETVDIGEYRFLAANAEGSRLLLQSETGAKEAVLYDTGSQTSTPLPELTGIELTNAELVVSADLSTAYFAGAGGLNRYDINGGKLEYLFAANPPPSGQGGSALELAVSADGRYIYFEGSVGGLPGDGTLEQGGNSHEEAAQVYRYDNDERVVECVSCASSYDPVPNQPAFLHSSDAQPSIRGSVPLDTSISGNGDYAFFTTPAALVPQDIDGEIEIETGPGSVNPDLGHTTSPSSDIYEWRANGVSGCGQLDGCLALITNGRGGYKSLLLGSADEGRDVFVYTREKLVPQDNDTAGDIYDARVEGGFPPPPPRPTECEADACSTPPSAPVDSTPASLTFTGVGNVLPVAPAGKPVVKKKAPPKKKHNAKKRKKGKSTRKGKAKKSALTSHRAKG